MSVREREDTPSLPPSPFLLFLAAPCLLLPSPPSYIHLTLYPPPPPPHPFLLKKKESEEEVIIIGQNGNLLMKGNEEEKKRREERRRSFTDLEEEEESEKKVRRRGRRRGREEGEAFPQHFLPTTTTYLPPCFALPCPFCRIPASPTYYCYYCTAHCVCDLTMRLLFGCWAHSLTLHTHKTHLTQ